MLSCLNVADSLLTGALAWAVGWQEILIIVVIVLILFGGRKIPELAKGLGKGLREFKREMRGVQQDFSEAIDHADEDDYTPPRRKRRKKRKKPVAPVADDEADDEDDVEPAPASDADSSET